MAKEEKKVETKAKAKKETVKAEPKKAEPKKEKRVITPETKVKVYNNRSHTVGFSLAGGKRVTLFNPLQYTTVTVEDLEVLLGNASALLTKGSLYVDDKEVREYINIEEYYKEKHILHRNDLAKLLDGTADQLAKSISTLSNIMLDELFDLAYSKLDVLTIGQVELLEKATRRKLLL